MVLKDQRNCDFKEILGMGLLQMGPSVTLCGRGQPCASLVKGLSLPVLNQFWLLWNSASHHPEKSCIFLSVVFLGRFP